MHVLLVEDNVLVASGIVAGLRLHRMTVYVAPSMREAMGTFNDKHFDVVVLDLGLPDGDGMTLLSRWRKMHATPILILTARDAVAHRIAGLEAGADDYMLKPFDLGELVARLHALRRRAAGRSSNAIEHGALSYDAAAGQVSLNGRLVELSRRELALLEALLQRPHHVLTVEQIGNHVYGLGAGVDSNALSVHIHHLRRKLGPRIVETVRGLGYRLGEAGT
jgi:two-component system, OmpR family, response regulator QseB